MADTGRRVISVEANPAFFGFAKRRLLNRRNVELMYGFSQAVLTEVLDGDLRPMRDERLFFYLDAHGKSRPLPLAEEIDIIFDRCSSAVVMVDDFMVPGDEGYAYEDYGQGQELTPKYIAPGIARHDLAVFYPSTPAASEDGKRRGCVVLCKSGDLAEMLSALPLLRPA